MDFLLAGAHSPAAAESTADVAACLASAFSLSCSDIRRRRSCSASLSFCGLMKCSAAQQRGDEASHLTGCQHAYLTEELPGTHHRCLLGYLNLGLQQKQQHHE